MSLAFTFALSCSSWCESADIELPAEVARSEAERIQLIEQMSQSFVAIFAPGGAGGGSGVLISPDGYVVTNFHVVQGSGGFIPCGLNDGQLYDSVLVGVDPTGDVAVIKLLGRDDFPHAKIGDSDDVQMGDMTYALGNPFLLATDFQPTATYGMVSGTHRYQYPAGTFLEYTDCIQVDTSINPGNSGGPLFNAQGELIGINGRIAVEKRGRVNIGAGYAISINQVMNFLDHLKSGRIVDHATLGAIVQSNSDGAVIVQQILESSAAYRRGLRRGDELITFGGRPVRSVNQFKNVLGIYPKGWEIPLSFQRDSETFDVTVQLSALHRRSELVNDAPESERREGEPEEQDPFKQDNPFHKKEEYKPADEFKHMYVERTGYVNYYFNDLAQQRLLASLQSWGDFNAQSKGWAINATASSGNSLKLRLQPENLAAQFGKDFAVQDLSEDFRAEPPGSGGLLPAMYQLQQLLTAPQDYFTEFYYLGSEPLDGTGPRVDVLITTRGTVTSRWYFDKSNNEFIGFDTALEDAADPCEIRFAKIVDIKELSNEPNGQESSTEQHPLKFPAQLSIRHAGELYDEIQINALQFYDPQAKGEAS